MSSEVQLCDDGRPAVAKPGDTCSQLLPPQYPRRAERSAHSHPHSTCELHIQESFHLPREALAIAMPPEFLHSRHAVDIEIFHPNHLIQSEAPVRSSQAARFHSTMRSLADSEARNYVVHHDGSRMNVARQPLATFRVARPHTGRQSVLRIICQPHSFIVVRERHQRQHRTESLLPHDAHILCHSSQHRGRVEVHTYLRQTGPTRENSSSTSLRIFHMRLDDPHLAFVDHWAHIRVLIHAIAHAEAPGLLF